MSCIIISSHLRPQNKCQLAAERMQCELITVGLPASILDLAETPLPPCDGGPCYQDPRVHVVTRRIADAPVILLVSPIYNYDFNSGAKNLLELTGKSWEDKVVGFVAVAGGQASYMAPLAFAGSLLLDQRCLVVPRYVYLTGQDFPNNALPDTGPVAERLAALARELARFALLSTPSP